MLSRRLGTALLLALVALGVASATATAPASGPASAAAAPVGPRLAVAVSRPYPKLSGIETVGPNGEDPVRLVGGEGEGAISPNSDQPAWSPDGELLAFTGSFGEYSPVPFVVAAGGGRPRLVSKAGALTDPIFSADAREVVFQTLRVVKGEFRRSARPARPARPSEDEYGVVVDWAVLAVDIDDGSTRLLTPWRRNQVLTPTSFSADGSKLAAERVTRQGGDAVAIELDSGRTRVLAHDAEEPVFSPDGSRVALVRTRHRPPSAPGENRPPGVSELFVMPAAGGRPVELARVKGGLAWPSWDPSGQRISFTRLGGGSFAGTSHPHQGNAIMEINADGTCLTRLLSIGDGNFNGSAWQPGPGREAGPILCG